MKKRLGEILMERGMIDVDQLNAALSHQRQWGMRLGTALVAKGFVAEGTLTRVLSESLGFPMVDLAKVVVDHKALALVTRRTCEQHDVLPLAIKEEKGRKVLLLAMADPLNAAVVDEIGFTTDTIVKPAIAQISSLEQAIRRYYYGQRVDIAPLNFASKMTPGGFLNADEPMTITGRGGASERVIVGRETVSGAGTNPGSGVIVELRDEVSLDAEAVQSFDPFTTPTSALPVDYLGQRTGVFSLPNQLPPLPPPTRTSEGLPVIDGDILSISRAADTEQIEALEKKFWALMRVLARRGLVTKEEFLHELRAGDGEA